MHTTTLTKQLLQFVMHYFMYISPIIDYRQASTIFMEQLTSVESRPYMECGLKEAIVDVLFW